MNKSSGITASIVGALAIAAVSTLGDFIWATWIPRHLPRYGLGHGTLLFLFVGLFLGVLAGKPGTGAVAGALIGGLAAGSFYLLAPIAPSSSMFIVWMAVWIALSCLHQSLGQRPVDLGVLFGRGALAAVASGAAFYAISGIWFPFNPRGWNYLVHFGAWTVAYLPGFAALLVTSGSRRLELP